MASATAVFTDKVEADVAAARLWKAAFEDAHNFLPKASPEIVSKVEYEGGGFEAGSTRTIFVNKEYAEKIAREKHPGKVVEFVKERIEEVDNGTRRLKTETIDGGFVGILFKSGYRSVVQVDEAGPAKSVVQLSVEYEPVSTLALAHAAPALHDSLSLGFANLQAFLAAHPELYPTAASSD